MFYTLISLCNRVSQSQGFRTMKSVFGFMMLATLLISCSGESKEKNKKNSTTSPAEKSSKSFYHNNVNVASDVTVLFDWNDAGDQDTLWNGWLWQQNVAYSNEGWVLDTGGALGSAITTYFGQSPRSFDKSDYKDDNLVEIVSDVRAPSTSAGGSFRVFDNPNNNKAPKQASWWMYYAGKPLSERGVTSESTDRMSFYIKLEGLETKGPEGTPHSIGTNFHVGTYLCWETGKSVYSTGDGCPREGPGNQHYYHYLGFNPGAWLHVELDDHPNHHRGKRGNSYHNNNPVSDSGKSYFAQLSRFYFEIRAAQKQHSEFVVDELEFYSTKKSMEPNQNDESITSLWVGYWPNDNYWEIGFNDGGNFSVGEHKFSTFEIRWSTMPITNSNYNAAKIITPEFYSGEKYVGANNPHYVRRANDYTRDVWTRFQLPQSVTNNYEKVYFAIKDVSKKGENQGTSWPWNRDDHGDASSKYIRTIDYALRPID